MQKSIEQALHERAVANGKKGGLKTLEKHGISHFVSASKRATKARKRKKSKLQMKSR